MSQVSINFSNSAIEQVGERHKQLVESANVALLRSRSRNGKFTSRHVWTQGELTDVCRAFIINYKEKTLAEIAQEIHTRFTEYIKLQDHHRQAIESDSDDELICQAHEYREGVPSISAIELKLIDCVNLCYQVSSGSCSKASKMHTEIWQHIMCAQKHREIIRAMKNAVATSATSATTIKSEQQDEPRTPTTPTYSSSSTASLEAPGAPVKAKKTATPPPRRKYLLESEEELPLAKRRKLNPEFEAATATATTTTAPEPAQRLSMSDICCALDEIADRMEQHGQCEQRYSHSVAQSIATIRQNQSDIALLMGYVQDTHTGIQKAHERIEAELAKLETMTVVPAAATATATKPKFDPSNYQCHECSQTFDPSIRGYWLIGAPCRNPNTTEAQEHTHDDDEDDMFYLCRECTRFENEHNDNHNDMGDMAFGVMEDGEYDYDDQYEDHCERALREHYDHGEECS
jgi:hypothetical protein